MVRVEIILVLALVVVFVTGDAHAGNIYRWVDEQGNINYGDKLPEKYISDARDVESTPVNTFEAPSINHHSGPQPSNNSDRDFTNRSSRNPEAMGSHNAGSCEVRMQRYKDSQECYATFCQNAGGGINAGKCTRCSNITRPRC